MIHVEDVVAASAAIGTRLHRTPMLSSASLGEASRGSVYPKAELFQRTGSFKVRGALAKLASLSPEEKERGVITISAGNHAGAVAYCCALEGIDALVVMSASASPQKVAATLGYGAEVDQEATTAEEAFARMSELQKRTGRTLVHPFDDPLVLAGQGTIGLEILEGRPDVGIVVVPAGGGGLVAGIAVAVKGVRPDVRVIAVEPEGSSALKLGLEAGEPVSIEPESIADGLSAPFAGRLPLEVCAELLDGHVSVTEAEIRAGFRFLYERAKLAAEPAGAVATAALMAGKIAAAEGSVAVAVVSGGNVATQTASAILTSNEG
ncbi:MAG: threonine ammonia-lyase [Gaiellaceae bacterium]